MSLTTFFFILHSDLRFSLFHFFAEAAAEAAAGQLPSAQPEQGALEAAAAATAAA
jgi:hypothetical protein